MCFEQWEEGQEQVRALDYSRNQLQEVWTVILNNGSGVIRVQYNSPCFVPYSYFPSGVGKRSSFTAKLNLKADHAKQRRREADTGCLSMEKLY